jgi:toxin CcdB
MTIEQFDVVANPVRASREHQPFLLCVQHHSLDFLKTRLMAPLISGKPFEKSRLNPSWIIGGQHVFLDPTGVAAVNLRLLAEPVTNFESERREIIAALDLVFTGV